VRFNEFKQALEGIPPRTLAARLLELEEAGVLERRVLDTRPPRVEYRLTVAGRKLRTLVRRDARLRRSVESRDSSPADDGVIDRKPGCCSRELLARCRVGQPGCIREWTPTVFCASCRSSSKTSPASPRSSRRYPGSREAEQPRAPQRRRALPRRGRVLRRGRDVHHGTSLISAHLGNEGKLRRDRQLVDGRRAAASSSTRTSPATGWTRR